MTDPTLPRSNRFRACASIMAALCLAAPLSHSYAMNLFVGTYTKSSGKPNGSRGIYRLEFDSSAGSFSQPRAAAQAINPTFLALSPDHKRLYATGEAPAQAAAPKGLAQGAIYSFSLGPDGTLDPMGPTLTGVGATTHLEVSPDGRTLAAVSYSGGYACALAIGRNGALAAPAAPLAEPGNLGPNRQRQDQSHPHCSTFSPDGSRLIVCDLGLDRVFSHPVNSAAAGLIEPAVQFAIAPAGVGPRHCAFSGDGRFLYVVNEMGGSVSTYEWKGAGGIAGPLQTLSSLPPEGFNGTNTSGEIAVHCSGRFVYASNRGPNSLAVFARDERTGLLERRQIIACGGAHPRHFALSPDGRWLLCANMETGDLTLFSIDQARGLLSFTGKRVAVPAPTCVLFAE